MTDTDVVPTSAPPARTRPAKRRFTRTTKIGTTIVLILALLESSGLTTRYFMTDRRWVIVDNAQVAGNRVEIRSPTDGRVVDWNIDTGSSVTTNQSVGRVEIQGTGVKPRRPVKAPGPGVIAAHTVSVGMYVRAGALLATAYDLDGVYVTARVPEAEMSDVHVGAAVDVLSDAYSEVPLSGTVALVSGAAAGVNELDGSAGVNPSDIDHPVYPDPDIDPQNPQKVEQYIPVRIQLGPLGDTTITPGQNVTVHIHRH